MEYGKDKIKEYPVFNNFISDREKDIVPKNWIRIAVQIGSTFGKEIIPVCFIDVELLPESWDALSNIIRRDKVKWADTFDVMKSPLSEYIIQTYNLHKEEIGKRIGKLLHDYDKVRFILTDSSLIALRMYNHSDNVRIDYRAESTGMYTGKSPVVLALEKLVEEYEYRIVNLQKQLDDKEKEFAHYKYSQMLKECTTKT